MLLVAGGGHDLATDQAQRLRAAIADDRPGRSLVRLLDDLRAAGFTVDGERLKRVPGQFGADHPRAGLLTCRTLWARREHEPAGWLHTATARDVVADGWRALQPLNDWLARHVGATRTERSRRP